MAGVAPSAIIHLELPGPLDLPRAFERFRRWGDDLLERWDGTTYRWTVGLDGRQVALAARPGGTVTTPTVDVMVEDGVGVEDRDVVDEVTARLVPSERARTAFGRLVAAGGDPLVAALDARYPGLRPVLQRDPLVALVRSISAQQINLTWAATMRRRLAEAHGVRHIVAGGHVVSLDAAALASLDPVELRAMQFTNRKAASIVASAQAIAEGGFELDVLAALDDAEVVERLTTLPGIGRWSADWFLARTLGRPVVVAGDLGVRKAVAAGYLVRGSARAGSEPLPSEAEVLAATGHWGEGAGIAQQLLLQWLGDGAPNVRGEVAPAPGPAT